MKNLIENKPQMCPQCGGQVELNVPNVNFAVGNPEKYQKKNRADGIETETNRETENLTENPAASVTERTTCKLFKSAVSK